MYEKQEWIGGKTGTPATPERMNHIEEGIYKNSQAINGQESMGSIVVDDISCSNKLNINNVKSTVSSSYSINNNQITIKNNGSWCACDFEKIEVEAGKEYTYSADFQNESGSTISLLITYEHQSTTIFSAENTTEKSGKLKVTFTPSQNYIFCRLSANRTSTSNNATVIFSNIQVKLGNEVKPYTPYKNFNMPIISNLFSGEVSSTNVSLNDKATNYDFLEILFGNTSRKIIKVPAINNKKIELSENYIDGNNLYIYHTEFKINDDTLELIGNWRIQITSSGATIVSNANQIIVFNVDGIKKQENVSLTSSVSTMSLEEEVI